MDAVSWKDKVKVESGELECSILMLFSNLKTKKHSVSRYLKHATKLQV